MNSNNIRIGLFIGFIIFFISIIIGVILLNPFKDIKLPKINLSESNKIQQNQKDKEIINKNAEDVIKELEEIFDKKESKSEYRYVYNIDDIYNTMFTDFKYIPEVIEFEKETNKIILHNNKEYLELVMFPNLEALNLGELEVKLNGYRYIRTNFKDTFIVLPCVNNYKLNVDGTYIVFIDGLKFRLGEQTTPEGLAINLEPNTNHLFSKNEIVELSKIYESLGFKVLINELSKFSDNSSYNFEISSIEGKTCYVTEHESTVG